MLSNAYFVAKFRFDTAENEPAKNLQNFRKMHFSKMHFRKMHFSNAHPVMKLPSSAGCLRRTRAEARRRLRGPTRRTAVIVELPARERRLAKFRQNVARFRLYRHRFLQVNMRFAAFFKIYQILKLKFLKFDKILQILRHFRDFGF